MDRIPTEILVKIISFLSTKDKLRSVIVSKTWEEIIINPNLFSTLSFSEARKFDSAVSFFNEERQHLAKTVNQLTINGIATEPQRYYPFPTCSQTSSI